MGNRKQVEADLERISQSKQRLQKELAELQAREATALQQSTEELLAGTETKSLEKLGEIRGRKEITEQAITIAETRRQQLQRELDDIRKGEIFAIWAEIEKQLCRGLEEFQEAIGENGIKGQLDQLEGLINQFQKEHGNIPSQDGQIFESHFRGIYVEASRSLHAVWQLLETINRDSAYHQERKMKLRNEGIPGFGKLP